MADPKVAEYIQSSRAIGNTKEKIFQALLASGYSFEVIEEAWKLSGGQAASSAVPPRPMEFPGPNLEVAEKTDDTQSRTVRIVVIIGAFLIGAGIFSFIASNWDGMSKFAKVALVVATMCTAYLAAYAVERRGYEKTAGALYLLGALTYGGGIFIVAQVFNIRAEWPDGFILWFLGVIAMAFAINSRLLFGLAVPLGIVAVIGYPFNFFNVFGGFNSFITSNVMTSTILLVAAVLASFGTAVSFKKKLDPDVKELY